MRVLLVLQADDARTAAASTNTANTSERLENPDVNPITGPGRPAALVRAELLAHQQSVRSTTGVDNTPPPIFQGDYLIMRSSTAAPLTLHRVVHGIFMQNATGADVTFTTCEYEQALDPLLRGLWGSFVPLKNAMYDKNNVRSGTKFVRRAGMTRANVQLYDVRVFYKERKQLLYIAAESLCALQLKLPADCPPWPTPLPVTHVGTLGDAIPPDPQSAADSQPTA
eukprot:1979764-Pleurochrysis_carterae.AAC.1